MKESNIQKSIMVELSKYGVPFRTNAGMAYQGQLIGNTLINIKPIKLLPEGFSDILFLSRTGKCIFIEFKTKAGKQRKSQEKFQKMVENMGFSYLIVRDKKDLECQMRSKTYSNEYN